MARPRFQNLDEATRKKILETAAVEFAANGFDGTSLNQLIESLGISKGSLYYYFDDKADLFITVVDHAWSVLIPAEIVDVGDLSSETYWPTLEVMMGAARRLVRENPWTVGFTRLIYDPPEIPGIRDALSERFEQARDWQADLIRQGQRLGSVRDDLPIELLQHLLIGADEAGDRWFVENWDHHTEEEIERFFTEVFVIFRRMMEPPTK